MRISKTERERRRKIGLAHKGRKKSPQECLNISLSKRGAKHPNWKGGRLTDDSGYIDILMPNWPGARANGYIREHKYIIEKFLGRTLRKDEQVHHKNGNKKDNRLENLEVINICDHARLHQVERNSTSKAHRV